MNSAEAEINDYVNFLREIDLLKALEWEFEIFS